MNKRGNPNESLCCRNYTLCSEIYQFKTIINNNTVKYFYMRVKKVYTKHVSPRMMSQANIDKTDFITKPHVKRNTNTLYNISHNA